MELLRTPDEELQAACRNMDTSACYVMLDPNRVPFATQAIYYMLRAILAEVSKQRVGIAAHTPDVGLTEDRNVDD